MAASDRASVAAAAAARADQAPAEGSWEASAEAGTGGSDVWEAERDMPQLPLAMALRLQANIAKH